MRRIAIRVTEFQLRESHGYITFKSSFPIFFFIAFCVCTRVAKNIPINFSNFR